MKPYFRCRICMKELTTETAFFLGSDGGWRKHKDSLPGDVVYCEDDAMTLPIGSRRGWMIPIK